MAQARQLADWLRLQEHLHGNPIDLGLDRVRAVAQRLGLLPFGPRAIIVAGTNGKGSTVACLNDMLLAQGATVGAFTSPHLLRYNERIRINGADASDAALVAAFEAIEAARGETTLTFFEYNALAALWLFRERGVQFAVLEVGLGGRLDAVNIVDAEAAVVCSIGMDHSDWLGPDLASIGREKAGVFRPGQLAVLADPDMVPVVEAEALRIGARPMRAGREYRYEAGEGHWRYESAALTLEALPLPALPGAKQVSNAAAAITVLAGLGLKPGGSALHSALRRLSLPGRFQVVHGPVQWILDVAHNEPAARVLAENLRARPFDGRTPGRTIIVAGILGDKDVEAIARQLAPCAQEWILCGIDAPRGISAEALRARSPHFAAALTANDVVAGMQLAAARAVPGDRIVVCGSFLTVTPALELLGLY